MLLEQQSCQIVWPINRTAENYQILEFDLKELQSKVR